MEPLDVSGFQPHVQTDARVVARGVQRVQRIDLPTRQPRHPVVVSEPTLRRVDEVPVVYPAEQLALAFTLITKTRLFTSHVARTTFPLVRPLAHGDGAAV